MMANTSPPARWYMLDKDGMATLCTDKADAEREAADAQAAWPHTGPHRAVQLIEADGRASHGQAPAPQTYAEALQVFESPRAKTLMRAWEEGWAACRDAEFLGKKAQNNAFNQSTTVNQCVAEDMLHQDHPGASHGQAPAQPAGPCAICGSDEPFTGTCGSGDPRALCKQPSTSPQATQQAPARATADASDAMAIARYKVVPSDASMFHRFAVVAGDGKQQLYLGREVECQTMAQKFMGAFLDGAFSYRQLAAPTAPPPQAAPAGVLEDAARWHWMAEYIVGTRTDLDDELIASATVDELRKLVDADLAARKQGASHD